MKLGSILDTRIILGLYFSVNVLAYVQSLKTLVNICNTENIFAGPSAWCLMVSKEFE
jgi:hypothetical protein